MTPSPQTPVTHSNRFVGEWNSALTKFDATAIKQLEGLLRRATKPLDTLADLADIANGEELELLVTALKKRDPLDGLSGYERRKARSAQREKQNSRSGREIGPLPQVKDPERRARCEHDLRLFLLTYFPQAFPLPFGDDHLDVIRNIEAAVAEQKIFTLAMPRGSGKTTICEGAGGWIAAYGKMPFLMIVHATEDKAVAGLEKIKAEFEKNELLAEDFPELCYPIIKLEGIRNRAKGQVLNGLPTEIMWKDQEIRFPTVPGSKASGLIFTSHGIDSAMRGANRRAPDGRRIRPNFILIDDPQTDSSAKSRDECTKRLEIITKGIKGLVGPGESLGGVIPCTVIQPGDVAHTLLNSKLYPDFNGKTYQLLYGESKRMDLWQQYASLLRLEKEEKRPCVESRDFYIAYRAEMDEGLRAGWEYRKQAHHVSAIQYAMELFLFEPDYFYAEGQNDPQDPRAADDKFLRAEDIAKKVTNYVRRQVPLDVRWITAHIDVQKNLLFYKVIGWTPNFSGYVLEYGTFPEQLLSHFTARQASPTLADIFPGSSVETALYKGLEAAFRQLFTTEYLRIDGLKCRLSILGVDANWQTKTVKKACVESPWAGSIMPMHGNFIGPNECPISEYKKREGEFIGDEWIIAAKNGIRYTRFDSNYWKTFAGRRLAAPYPNPGCLVLYGPEGTRHTLLSRHLDSEIRTPTTGKRTVDQWDLRPGESENHWWDNTVANCVLASISGAQTTQTERTQVREEREIKF